MSKSAVQPCLQNEIPGIAPLTYEGGEKTDGKVQGEGVDGVVVTVNLQKGERAEEKGDLQVVVPGGKGLQPGHDFVDAFAELHVVRVVLGGVVDGGVGALERGLRAAVGEGAPVVGDEGLGGVAAGECLGQGGTCLHLQLSATTDLRFVDIQLGSNSVTRWVLSPSLPLHIPPDQSDACTEYAISLSGLSWAERVFGQVAPSHWLCLGQNQNKHQDRPARLLNGLSAVQAVDWSGLRW